MTARRVPRIAASLHERRNTARAIPPLAERLLLGIGAHPAFAEAVLGDLAEERARRRERNGATAARWWYIREAIRSVPYLAWNAVRKGGRAGRARVAALVTTLALVPTVALLALLPRESDDPPAALLVDGQRGGSDGIVLNTRHPVQLAMRVLDAKGRTLPSADVRYRWIGGAPLPVTSSGVVICARTADATIRVSVGTLSTIVVLHCRPVREISGIMRMNFLVGDSGRDLHFAAYGPDRRQVSLLAGDVRVLDSTVATLKGFHVRPVAPGRTTVIARIGDAEAWTAVSVYEPVRSFAELRPEQKLVVAPVRLAPGDTIRWPLPRGLFSLQYSPVSRGQRMPSIVVEGPVMCMPAFAPGVDDTSCLVRGAGASIRLAHPGASAREIAGNIALSRWENQGIARPCQTITSSKC